MDANEALARLVTDRTARDRFLADADAWLREAALSPDDARSIAAVPRDALVRYAESLLDKRVAELVHAVPCSAALFPPLREVYRAWLSRHPAPSADDVLSPGLREALRALAVVADAVEPEWVAELWVYEVLWRSSRRDGRRRRLSARWPHHAWIERIEAGEIPVDPDEAPREYVFP